MSSVMTDKTVLFKIRRQASPNDKPRWEEFELPWHAGMNVISSMMEIARNSVTRDGKPTTPIIYDSNCLQELCGACPRLINGRAPWAAPRRAKQLDHRHGPEPPPTLPAMRKWLFAATVP